MTLPKGVTVINMACPEQVLEVEMLEVLSARTDFCHISSVPREKAERSQSASQADTAHFMVPALMTPRAREYDSSAGRRAEEALQGQCRGGSERISHDLSHETDDSSQAESVQHPSKRRQRVHPAAL